MKSDMTKSTTGRLIVYLAKVLAVSVTLVLILVSLLSRTKNNSVTADSVPVKSVNSQIMAEGIVRSQNEASLHFAVGGKVTYLPFREGDAVSAGQTIASVDTYTIQKQLQLALNTYRSVRDGFDQTQANFQDNILKTQQLTPYDFFAKAGLGGSDRDVAINDALNRILDQTQANLDNSVIQVELANYAYTLATLTSPINGILLHEDITTPNVIATPVNTFTVIDPSALVFRANVSEDDINYIAVGSPATIKLSGQTDKSQEGTVAKIYPNKITLPNGENVYPVDITSDGLSAGVRYQEAGVALISNNLNRQVSLVPTWLILSGNQIWVNAANKPVLKTIQTGDRHGNFTEVTGGLENGDRIITNPTSVISKNYLVY